MISALDDDQDQMTDNNGMVCLYLNVYILFYYICAELAQKFAPKKRTDFRLCATRQHYSFVGFYRGLKRALL